jgi:hypothetical protein
VEREHGEPPRGAKRRPDYNLAALDRGNEEKGKVGAAWKNVDGSISIRLEPFVVLRAGVVLTLFPRSEEDNRR